MGCIPHAPFAFLFSRAHLGSFAGDPLVIRDYGVFSRENPSQKSDSHNSPKENKSDESQDEQGYEW